MSSIFTPMKASGTVVLLQGEQLGGFDLHGCPAPEALAKFIADSCNEATKLKDRIAILEAAYLNERARLSWIETNCAHESTAGWHLELGNDYPIGKGGYCFRDAIDYEMEYGEWRKEDTL
jgi:hypothetical protein